jgi:hypothetical protein
MPVAAEPVVLGVALAYGGLAQLLAGMWEFKKGLFALKLGGGLIPGRHAGAEMR